MLEVLGKMVCICFIIRCDLLCSEITCISTSVWRNRGQTICSIVMYEKKKKTHFSPQLAVGVTPFEYSSLVFSTMSLVSSVSDLSRSQWVRVVHTPSRTPVLLPPPPSLVPHSKHSKQNTSPVRGRQGLPIHHPVRTGSQDDRGKSGKTQAALVDCVLYMLWQIIGQAHTNTHTFNGYGRSHSADVGAKNRYDFFPVIGPTTEDCSGNSFCSSERFRILVCVNKNGKKT